MDLSIRITHRAAQDCNPAETTIELGRATESPALPGFLDAIVSDVAPASQLEWSGTLCDGKRVNFAAAEKACAALGEGWRLPTRQELESILALDRYEPAIDTARFPDTQSGAYWTSTPCAWSSDCAWFVYFYHGLVDDLHRGNSNVFVRAVRSVPAGQ